MGRGGLGIVRDKGVDRRCESCQEGHAAPDVGGRKEE